MPLDITNMAIECNDGTAVKVWCKCHTADDIDEVIAWLRLARDVMIKWEKIHAKASRATKAAAGKNENHQPRQVQGEPQADRRPDG